MINSTNEAKRHATKLGEEYEVCTHGGWKDNNSQDIHSIACSFPSAYEHIRRWRQVQGKVLDVCSIIILDTVDKRSPCAGLWLCLTHRRLGFHNVLATCSILLAGNRNKSWKDLHLGSKKKLSLCVWKCCVWYQRSHLLKCGLDQISWEHVSARQRFTIIKTCCCIVQKGWTKRKARKTLDTVCFLGVERLHPISINIGILGTCLPHQYTYTPLFISDNHILL